MIDSMCYSGKRIMKGGAMLIWRVNGVSQLHAYCLFCETQRCGIIAELITRNYGYRCFSPQIIQRKWVKGVPTEKSHDWLPGYVFLYAEEEITPAFPINGIIRCLGKGELTGHDLAFAQMLYRKNGKVGNVAIMQEGNRCVISDSSWEGLHGTICKMDRERRRCCVRFEFDGMARTIWVGYELIETKNSG